MLANSLREHSHSVIAKPRQGLKQSLRNEHGRHLSGGVLLCIECLENKWSNLCSRKKATMKREGLKSNLGIALWEEFFQGPNWMNRE